MDIQCEKEKMVFSREVNGKIYYSLGLSKKNQDGTYTSGYINCRFPKNANIENQTKIKIVNAWLDFYLDDKKITHPYIFINKYEIIENKEIPQNYKSEYDNLDSDVKLEDKDLPFL